MLLFTYQDLKEVVVRDVGQLGTVELGDHELFNSESALPSRAQDNANSKQNLVQNISPATPVQ